MEWAKLCSQARFNLATSGILNVPSAEFPQPPAQMEVTGYDSYGHGPLQERMGRHAGVPANCIVAAAGTSMANHLAMAAILNAGDEVLIEQPVYGPLLDVANYLGAHITRIARRFENDFAIDLDQLAESITPATRLIVLTNLHNPSGASIPSDTLRKIGELAHQAGARVLVDEAYLEMGEDAAFSFPAGQSVASEDNPFIVTNSLTKAYGLSGLRCGWIVASPPIARQMWRLNNLFGVNAAHPAEQMSILAFDHLEQFRERTRKLLSANRTLLNAFLNSRNDLECYQPNAGTIVFPRLARGNTEAFVHLLREKYETSVVPGKFFEMPQHFRLGVGGDTENVRKGLERLSDALDEFGR